MQHWKLRGNEAMPTTKFERKILHDLKFLSNEYIKCQSKIKLQSKKFYLPRALSQEHTERTKTRMERKG